MTGRSISSDQESKKIWIDLDNSPHVLFFNPIHKELKKRGYRVVLTARDYAQVVGLADLYNLEYTKIGRHYGKHKLFKVIGLLVRSFQMVPFLWKEKPDIAISHGSRSQILISKIIGLPVICAFDYEHVKIVPFVIPTYVMVPEMIPEENVKNRASKVIRYPGIKEDVYVNNFIPDSSILQWLGIHDGNVVVTVRPPATVAHYHSSKSDELFITAVEYICGNPNAKIIVMPRTKKQEVEIRGTWPEYISSGKIIIPEGVVNGLNVIWNSDMVISAGGTMIREAAALGVPAYSIFGGEIGAVDRYLAEVGRLTLIRSDEDVCNKIVIEKRQRAERVDQSNHAALSTIVNEVIEILQGRE